MIDVVIIGTGNVAQHLLTAFSGATNVRVLQVVGRNKKVLNPLKKYTQANTFEEALIEADIYIISVSDDAISSVYENLKVKDKLIVHTSGSAPMDVLLPSPNRGSFYPLQSFSKERDLDFTTIPICIEAADSSSLELLRTLGTSISNNVRVISSEQRKSLHMSAVFVNNFVNHLYHIGDELCSKNGVPFDILRPLISETTNKVMHMAPYNAQTGPARRNDLNTIKMQSALLSNKDYKEIYELMSRSILEIYGKKL